MKYNHLFCRQDALLGGRVDRLLLTERLCKTHLFYLVCFTSVKRGGQVGIFPGYKLKCLQRPDRSNHCELGWLQDISKWWGLRFTVELCYSKCGSLTELWSLSESQNVRTHLRPRSLRDLYPHKSLRRLLWSISHKKTFRFCVCVFLK